METSQIRKAMNKIILHDATGVPVSLSNLLLILGALALIILLAHFRQP